MRWLWAVERDGDGWEVRLPTGQGQLLVNQVEDRLTWRDGGAEHTIGGAGVSGPATRPLAITPREQRATVGAVFTPLGLAAFLDVDVGEARDGLVPVVGGHAMDRIRQARGEAALRALLK